MATERIDVVVTETGTREVSRRIEDVGRAAARASGPLLAMQRLLASYVSFEGIRRMMRLADQFTEMENRIRVLDGTTQHYSVTLRRLYNISQETRSSLRDNVLLFQRMGLAQRELGATTEELFQVTRAVGQAIAIQGGLATTSAGAVLQLSQAFGSGRVQLEEFNSVITGLYPIAKAAAEGIDATGGSIARLRRMIADGEVDSRMLFQGILNSIESLDEQFKQTTPTVSQSFTILRNAALMYVGDLNTASGASESFARGIISLSNNMDEVVKGAVVVGAALGPMGLTRIVLGLRTAFLALNAAIMANPFGAIATAISASVTYLLLFNKKLDEFAKGIDESATVVDRLGATWAGVLAYIKKAWEDFPRWFGELIERVVDEGIKSLSKFGTRLFGDLEADVKQGEKILDFFGIKIPGYVNRAKDSLPQFKEALEDTLNFDLPPGVIDRQKDNGSQAAQAFADAYEDYLRRARHRREQIGGSGDVGGGLPPGMPDEKAIKKLQKELDRVLDMVDPVEAAWRKFFESVDTLDKGLAAGILTLDEYQTALNKLQSVMLDDLFPFEAILRGLLDQQVLLSKEVEERERLAQIYEIEKDLKRALTDEELRLVDARLKAVQMAEREARLMDEIRQPTLEHSRNIRALSNLYRDGAISADEFRKKVNELQYEFLQSQTDFASGVERGLIAIEQDFTDVASSIEQAMVRAFGNIEDALTQFLRAGKMDVKSFVNSVLDDIARLFVRQNITGPIAQMMGGLTGSGQQLQQAGGGFGFGGGTFGASSIEMAGDWLLRSGLAPETGAKMLMNADNIAGTASSILGYGKAIFDLAEGNYGSAAGTAIGTYIMPGPGTVVGSVIGGFVDDLFGNRIPTTRRSQQGASHMLPDGTFEVSSWDDRQDTASQEAARDFAQAAVKHANDLFESIGIDAQIHSFQTLMESSILGDRQGVGSSGQVRIGDVIRDIGLTVESSWTQHGFGGWSDAPMLPRLQTDIQLTLLEAFQAVGDQLPSVLSGMLEGVDIRALGAEEAQALVQAFSAMVEQINTFRDALNQLPFERLKNLSFDAAAAMLEGGGGLEATVASLNSYFQNFYSEQEQLAWRTQVLRDAFSDLGWEMPDVNQGIEQVKAQFRALVESIDPTTEAGARLYAQTVSLSPALAQLVNDLSKVEDAAQNIGTNYDTLLQEAINAGEAAYRALQRSVNAEKARLKREADEIAKTLRTAIEAASDSVRELTALVDRLRSTLNTMVVSQPDQTRTLEWARSFIEQTLAASRLSGRVQDSNELQNALQIVATPSEELNGSFEEYQLQFLKTAHEVALLTETADIQLTIEQRMLESLERQLEASQEWYQKQIERLDATLENARKQLDIAMGTYEAVLTVPAAIAKVEAAVKNIRLVQAQRQEAQRQASLTREERYFENNPDVAAAYKTGGFLDMSKAEAARWHYENYGRREGRSFAVGTNYVPYDMTARIHEGERIIPKADNAILIRQLENSGNQYWAMIAIAQSVNELKIAVVGVMTDVEEHVSETTREIRRIADGDAVLRTEAEGITRVAQISAGS